MKRNPWFAAAVLLFLLLALLGSWVYLNHYPLPFSNDTTNPCADERAGGPAVDVAQDVFVDTSSDQPEVGTAGDHRTGEPLESPPDPRPEPVKRDPPTEPKPTPEPTKPEAPPEKPKAEIVAEFAPGAAGVKSDDESTDGLDPFIVSTLRSAEVRSKAKAFEPTVAFSTAIVPKSKIDKDMGQVSEIENVMVGRLIWPTLPKEQLAALKEADRRQAVVYLEKLPELRAVVDSDTGWFFLEVTETLVTEFKKKGLRVVVHSPAFEISGGFESVDVKEKDGALSIYLDVTPVIQVVVDVTPPQAVASGVRVWLEREGAPMSPDYDDSLYMSAKVPSSGRLIFSVPEHYGQFSVAATGEGWHSGRAQALDTSKWKTTRVDVNMSLMAERCDMVTGEVTTPSRDEPVSAARLECTHFGTAVYTDPKGAFQMYVPWDRGERDRRFNAAAIDLRPEIVPLETGGTGSPGVTGDGPVGPFRIKLAATVYVDLKLPKGVRSGTLLVGSSAEVTPEHNKAEDVVMWWGTSFLYIQTEKGELQTLCIDAHKWSAWRRNYSAGAETKPLEPELFEDAFKKR